MRIERVLANNPGPFTGPGTNTWLLDDGNGRLVIIDPGPVDMAHRDRILERLAGTTPVGVLVTHTHPDHAPLANPLAGELGVPAYGYAPGPEFRPDVRLADGTGLDVGRMRLHVIHTPGHSDDHLCFRVEDVLFTGDHIMGGSSVMVEDMARYLDSLTRLRGTGLIRLHPGHGEDMGDPDRVIDWYLAHRRQRHEQIFEAIRDGASATTEIVDSVYADVDRSLHPLASKSVEAHLTLLREEGRIALGGDELVVVPPTPS
jgi:glyoxylase-like metal-dependent hydrolase (beta-lactamase superfamily II)